MGSPFREKAARAIVQAAEVRYTQRMKSGSRGRHRNPEGNTKGKEAKWQGYIEGTMDRSCLVHGMAGRPPCGCV